MGPLPSAASPTGSGRRPSGNATTHSTPPPTVSASWSPPVPWTKPALSRRSPTRQRTPASRQPRSPPPSSRDSPLVSSSRAHYLNAAAAGEIGGSRVPRRDWPRNSTGADRTGRTAEGRDRTAEASRNTPDPHMVLDAAIEQASAAVAQLEATRAGARQQSCTRASDVAVDNDRPAYRAEPKVAQ